MADTVLIVPGVAGSELYTDAGSWLYPRSLIWLGYAALLAGAWRALQLDDAGTGPALPFYPPLQPYQPLRDYYESLGAELGVVGYRVGWPHLDWRQPIALDAARLRLAILDHWQGSPVSLVCHSRGGLVATAALADMAARGELDLVGQCVGLGVPHQGSWGAASLLAGWDETVTLLYRLLLIAPGILSLGAPASELLTVIRSWPAAYELLPRPGALWARAEDVALAYEPSWWTDGGAPIRETWLAAAAVRWAAAPQLPAEVAWVDVVGYGETTPVGLSGLAIAGRGSLAVAIAGDGLIVEQSARAPGRAAARVPVPHGALPYDGRAVRAIVAGLRGEITTDVTAS